MALTGEPLKSSFRLDTDSSDIVILPDGRKLGYAQYGSLTGRAIFFQHGHPGSRIEGAYFEEMGLRLDARVIAADRPGMGWSSPHPGHTLLDHPKDIEHLAKHLNLDSYSVLGVSGGGPYALACAMSLPRENLRCVSIMCGLGPPDIGMKGANFLIWLAFSWAYRYLPPVLTRCFLKWFWQRQPAGRLDLTDEKRLELSLQQGARSQATSHEKDRDINTDKEFLQLSLRSSRESFAQGFDGTAQDARLMSTDFGFRLEDIRSDLPVQLWYGKYDDTVPLNHGEQMAARLGGRAHLRVEDETHASIFINRREEAVKEILSNM